MIPQKLFWCIITSYLLIGLYIFLFSIQSPMVGIVVEKKSNDNNWIITNFEYPELGELHNINQGDFIIKINNEDTNNFRNLQYDNMIRSAKSLMVKKSNGELHDVIIQHLDLPSPFLTYFVLPLCYFLIALFLAIYSYFHKTENILSLNILILFLLTVALTYGSIPASTRLNQVGVTLNSTCMNLSLVLLLYFLKSYFTFLNIKLKCYKYFIFLFLLPILIFVLSILENFYPKLYSINTTIILTILFILFITILVTIVISYYKYPTIKIKLIFWIIVVPFLPFLFLFALPKILFNQYIISSTTSGLFLLLIPFGFIFTQLTERLYDIDYHISRFRYYLFISLFLTTWITTGTFLLTSLSLEKLTGLVIFIFISLLIFFYIKEKLDYYNRKVLFSSKGDYIHLLYSTIDEIGKTVNIQDIFKRLSKIVRKQLEMDTVHILRYDFKDKKLIHVLNESIQFGPSIDISVFENLQIREVKKIKSVIITCIHQDMEAKHFLYFRNKDYSKLRPEELYWLESLILYLNSFIENTKLVEDLINELKVVQEKGDIHPLWLKKLVWLQLEKEKSQLAQELHDTILQEQIFLFREIDSILSGKEDMDDVLQNKISNLQKQLLELNHQLRSYCEKLKPPLLDTLGLNAALNKLINQTKKRANFTLIHFIESIDITNNQIPILIYRIIQELLNNAIKHSQATYVKVQLKNYKNGFEIFYMDNGIGCDIEVINKTETMGLTGLKERIFAYNGYINIDTYPNEGMQINIQLENI